MDAERFGIEAVTLLAETAARCSCAQLSVGPLESAVSTINDLVSSGHDDMAVGRLEHPGKTALDGWVVSESISSLTIGDRAVLHETAEGTVIALDEAADRGVAGTSRRGAIVVGTWESAEPTYLGVPRPACPTRCRVTCHRQGVESIMTAADGTLDDRSFDASVYQVRGDAILRRYDNESVSWSPVASEPVHLDPLASIVYELFESEVSVGDLLTEVNEVLGVPKSVARSQVRRVVAILNRGALMTTSMPAARSGGAIDLMLGPPNP